MSNYIIENFDKVYNYCEAAAKSKFIPKHLRNSAEDVLMAFQKSIDLGVSINYVMENSYIMHDEINFKSQFLIGLANRSGKFQGNITFSVDYDKDNEPIVTAHAIEAATKKEITESMSFKYAKKCGYINKNKKYEEMPIQMLSWRAGISLVRKNAPEVLDGSYSIEEMEDEKGQVISEHDYSDKDLETNHTEAVSNKLDEIAKQAHKYTDEMAASLDQEQKADYQDQPDNQSEAPIRHLLTLIDTHNVPQDVINKWLHKAMVDNLEDLKQDQVEKCIRFVRDNYAN